MEQTNEKREASKGQSFELSTTKEKQRKENVKQTASEQNQQRKGNGEKNASSTQSTKSFLRHFTSGIQIRGSAAGAYWA